MSLIKPVRATQINKTHPLARDLKSCWLINEATGNKVFDMADRKTGQVIDALWKAGKFGSALEFNGSTGKVSVGNVHLLAGATQFTIMFWAMSNIDLQEAVGAHYGGVAESYEFSIDWQGWTDGFYLVFANTSGQMKEIFTYNKYLYAKNWYQITGIYDGLYLRIYINSKLEGSQYVGSHTVRYYQGGNFTFGGECIGYFDGIIDNVMIWRRALSAAEIKQLYREPFIIYEQSGAKALSFPITIKSLSGSVNVQSSLTGKLSTSNKSDVLEKTWLLDVIANAMTANALKSGTSLSMGWFWMRNSGCSALYRGTNFEQIDFENIIAIAEHDAENIQVPDFCEHQNETTYYYVLRKLNKCGYLEQTFSAAVKLALDSEGNIEQNQTNIIFTSNVEIVQSNKVLLKWFYCTLEQKSQPVGFNVYCDNGSGQIDFENPVAYIEYSGPKLYYLEITSLEVGTHLFAIRVVNSDDIEDNSSEQIQVQIVDTNPAPIEIITAESC